MAVENHILVLYVNDPLVLAGCHVKKQHHPQAQICTPKTIENTFKDPNGPWKLHIIAHGDQTGSYSGSKIVAVSGAEFSPSMIASYVVKSGLPNKSGATVRLDSCYAGCGGSVGSLVSKLKKELDKHYGPKCEILVEGALGQNVLGWDYPANALDQRVVIRADDAVERRVDSLVNQPARNLYQTELDDAENYCNNLNLSLTPKLMEVKARVVYQKIQGYLTKFNTDLKRHPSMVIDKATTPYKFRM
jgi:hypothetical protein